MVALDQPGAGAVEPSPADKRVVRAVGAEQRDVLGSRPEDDRAGRSGAERAGGSQGAKGPRLWVLRRDHVDFRRAAPQSVVQAKGVDETAVATQVHVDSTQRSGVPSVRG